MDGLPGVPQETADVLQVGEQWLDKDQIPNSQRISGGSAHWLGSSRTATTLLCIFHKFAHQLFLFPPAFTGHCFSGHSGKALVCQCWSCSTGITPMLSQPCLVDERDSCRTRYARGIGECISSSQSTYLFYSRMSLRVCCSNQ